MQAYFGQDGICHETDPSRVTDELREKLSEYKPQEIGDEFIAHPIGEVGYDIMMALCDSIDAVHANLERENAALKAELDRVQGEQEDRRSCIYYDPKRNYCSRHDIDTDALIEPPKDADKANICVGGKLDGYGKTIEVVELRHGRSGWVLISREGNAYADTYAFTHHHAPTVEDVLRGVVTLCRNTWKEGSAFEFYDVDDVMKSGNIAEYAAKLRLAESEDA